MIIILLSFKYNHRNIWFSSNIIAENKKINNLYIYVYQNINLIIFLILHIKYTIVRNNNYNNSHL
jgi:hypothetical protein